MATLIIAVPPLLFINDMLVRGQEYFMKQALKRWRRVNFSFPLAVVLSVCLLLVSEYSYHRSTLINNSLHAALNARFDLQSLLSRLLDAETGQRGYLLTGKAEYLRPYQEASVSVDDALKPMRLRYANNPITADDFERLSTLIAKKMEELNLTVALRSSGTDAWRSILETDAGRQQMETIRVLAEKLRDAETVLIQEHQQTLRGTLMVNRLGIAAMVAISLLAFLMYLRQSSLLSGIREQQRQQLQKDHDTLEMQVRDRTRRLAQLAAHLQNVRDDERSRLARELHDELGGLLVAAKLDLARLKSRLTGADTFVQERLLHLNEALNNGISLKRRIIEDLYPSSLGKLGLVAAIEILTREFSARSSIECVCKLDVLALSPAAELTIYRLVQEALTNIIKYAQATRVEINLHLHGDAAQIMVSDDGRGFNTASVSESSHGLEGMRYRVASMGGDMAVDSAPGAGVTITALLPLTTPAVSTDTPA